MSRDSRSWSDGLTLLAWMFSIFISCCCGNGRWAGLCSTKLDALPRRELCEINKRSVSWQSWKRVPSWNIFQVILLKKKLICELMQQRQITISSTELRFCFIHRKLFQVLLTSLPPSPFFPTHNHKYAFWWLLKDQEYAPNTIQTSLQPLCLRQQGKPNVSEVSADRLDGRFTYSANKKDETPGLWGITSCTNKDFIVC